MTANRERQGAGYYHHPDKGFTSAGLRLATL